MKLSRPTFILAVVTSALAHMIGVVMLIEITKKNTSFYQEIVTLTLLPNSAAPTEADSETPKPLSRPIQSNPPIRPNQWRSFDKHPTLVDPEAIITSIPTPSQTTALVHRENTIPALTVRPQKVGPASTLEAMPPLTQDMKSVINKSVEVGAHIANSAPPTRPSILQTRHHFLHERLSNLPASPPLHSSSTKTTASQPRPPLEYPDQNTQRISLIRRNESIAEYKLEELGNHPPTYPRIARQLGLEGRVVLLVLVTSAGRAKNVSVLKTSGAEILDDAAISAVAQWTFAPATIREIGVESTILVPIRFRLEN